MRRGGRRRCGLLFAHQLEQRPRLSRESWSSQFLPVEESRTLILEATSHSPWPKKLRQVGHERELIMGSYKVGGDFKGPTVPEFDNSDALAGVSAQELATEVDEKFRAVEAATTLPKVGNRSSAILDDSFEGVASKCWTGEERWGRTTRLDIVTADSSYNMARHAVLTVTDSCRNDYAEFHDRLTTFNRAELSSAVEKNPKLITTLRAAFAEAKKDLDVYRTSVPSAEPVKK